MRRLERGKGWIVGPIQPGRRSLSMHLSSVRRIITVLVAALSISVVASSAAQAAGNWFVNGTELAGKETVALSTTAKIDESTVLDVPSLAIRITCSGGSEKVLKGVKPYIQAPNTGGAESLIFEGCSEVEPTGCTIKEEKVETEPVVATLEKGSTTLDKVKFVPGGKKFANIDFLGTCSLAGEKPVNGAVTLHAPFGQTELVSQALLPLGTTENNSLELAGSKAYLEKGSALLLLAKGQKWSFH
jgi:hypothetical protein